MRRLLLTSLMLLAASPVFASDLKVCIDNSILTADLPAFLNDQYLPQLPQQMITSIGDLGGHDPWASVQPFSITIVRNGAGKNVLQIQAPEIKYSSRFGDTPIFKGARVGVRGSLLIQAGLTLDPTGTSITLTDVSVKTVLRADLGGTIGHYLGEVLTAVANGFGIQGKVSRQIQAKLQGLQTSTSFLGSNVQKDDQKVPIRLRASEVAIGDQQFCLGADYL